MDKDGQWQSISVVLSIVDKDGQWQILYRRIGVVDKKGRMRKKSIPKRWGCPTSIRAISRFKNSLLMVSRASNNQEALAYAQQALERLQYLDG